MWSSITGGVSMYWFSGFFARTAIRRPATLPAKAVWREITAPFTGVGVRLPALSDDKPGPEQARRLLGELGLGGAANWLFINYVTWAGRIDSVYGLGSSDGRVLGPISESGPDAAQAAYLELMGAFGVSEADALHFAPFVRGFWAE
jgi:hypothetical protein